MTTEKSKVELLAPLNNWKSISDQTKVLENADAVYFGLKTNFSMRGRADNFALVELPMLVKRIHDMGKKAYLTTNIIIYNTELVELHQTIKVAHSAGMDAIICHDIAPIMIAKDIGIPFHVSTQANISNAISAKYYEELGAERIILARELSLKDIKTIVSSVNIPVECFVHGQMCTAVSRMCYFSSEIMGFDPEYSANRGKCVQPCRRMYTLVGEEGEKMEYHETPSQTGMFFNNKDLCMIKHVPELIVSGIASFKIEGRMRDPLYISETIACYREAIDCYYDHTFSQEKIEGWMKRLKKVFNRGFHTGYYFSPPTPDDIERSKRGNASEWHKIKIGKVLNYYKNAQAIEVELHHGKLSLGDELIFENQSDFWYKMVVDSLRLEDESVGETPKIQLKEKIIVGIGVKEKIPINSDVYIYKKRDL